jgi:hypothetical protein
MIQLQNDRLWSERELLDRLQIEYQILAERKFLISSQHGKIRGEQRITDPRHLYLCEDDELLQWYYDEVDKRTKAAGLKPDDMCGRYKDREGRIYSVRTLGEHDSGHQCRSKHSP